MILSDRDIKKEIKNKRLTITPYNSNFVQPASYDVTLGSEVRVFKNTQKAYLDVKEDASGFMELIKIPKSKPLIVHPGEFMLGTTLERVSLPDDIVGQLNGRSSLGRLGLIIHATAGYVDPGFEGFLTLEMTNVSNIPIALYPGMRIGQIAFLKLSSPSEKPYGPAKGSKYKGQKGPTESRIWKDFTK